MLGVPVFCFRLPFTMPNRTLLGLTEIQYYLQEGYRRVWLKSTMVDDQPLSDATSIVLRGEGYATESEAADDGERWRDVLSRAFARLHLAADFGDRKPFATLTEAGEKHYSEQLGYPVLGDRPGVTVFEDQPGLRFVASTVEACRRPSEGGVAWCSSRPRDSTIRRRVHGGWPSICTAARSSSFRRSPGC